MRAVPENRRNPLWFEADGDFNPGWALFIAFSVLGALSSLAAIVAVVRDPAAWPFAVAALSFDAFGMLATAVIVVPIARAKLLVKLRSSVGDIAGAASGGGSTILSASTLVAGGAPTSGEILGAEQLVPPVTQGRPNDA